MRNNLQFPVKELLVMEILSTRKIQHLMGTGTF